MPGSFLFERLDKEDKVQAKTGRWLWFLGTRTRRATIDTWFLSTLRLLKLYLKKYFFIMYSYFLFIVENSRTFLNGIIIFNAYISRVNECLFKFLFESNLILWKLFKMYNRINLNSQYESISWDFSYYNRSVESQWV